MDRIIKWLQILFLLASVLLSSILVFNHDVLLGTPEKKKSVSTYIDMGYATDRPPEFPYVINRKGEKKSRKVMPRRISSGPNIN